MSLEQMPPENCPEVALHTFVKRTSEELEQMPPENCPEVSCVNWVECGGNVSTSKIRNAAELRMCPACGVPLVLTWDTGAECVRVWPASGQLASYLRWSWRNS